MLELNRYINNTAVITDKGECLTYGDLIAEMARFAGSIVEKGLLFCFCENSLGSFVGYVACVDHNIPIVLLDGSKELSTLQNLIDIYQPEYIWMRTTKTVGIGGENIYNYADFSLQKMFYKSEVEKKEFNPDLSICLTTSGSTGSPKLVRLSAKNVLANAESIATYLGIDENERPITSLPMYYSYGVSVINSHLIKGATILLTEGTIAQREFWTFLKEHKATSMSGVPYTYEMLKRLRFFRMDLPYLKTMTQAGGKLNKDLAKEYIDFAKSQGKRFFVMYGQTEATARMSYLPFENAEEKYSSIGIAIPGGKFSLIDAEGNTVDAPNINGELVYEGENVSMGYAECRADLAKDDENHGVLHTGDVACRDDDGFYYITGRLRRFVKIWGNRVNLDAIEQMVKKITTDCACAGVDDKITIFVVQASFEEQIMQMLSEKTGLNRKAFEIQIVNAIPKNSSGKVQYAELQKILK